LKLLYFNANIVIFSTVALQLQWNPTDDLWEFHSSLMYLATFGDNFNYCMEAARNCTTIEMFNECLHLQFWYYKI